MEIEKLFEKYNTEDILSSLIEMQISPNSKMRGIRIPAAEYFISNLIRHHISDSKEKYTSVQFSELMDFGIDRFNPSVNNGRIFRGDGYFKQTSELAKLLYAPLDEELKEKLGFTYTCCEKVVLYILRQYAIRLSKALKNGNSYSFVIKSLWSTIAKKQRIAINPSISAGYVFRITKGELYQEYGKEEIDNLIEVFGIKIGDAAMKPVGLTDPKPLHEKPFLDFGRYIYLPLPELTLKNLPKLFHNKLIDPEIFDEHTLELYKNNRSTAVEGLSRKHLKKLFGESGMLLQNDDASVFFDCKSDLLTLSALQGYTKTLEGDINRAIETSCDQAIRSIGDILPNTENNFVICVTPENFGVVPLQMNARIQTAQDLKVVPIIMDLFDLEIITNECKTKEEFIGYLMFRKTNCQLLLSVDELYVFWLYNKNGNVETDINADPILAIEYIQMYDKKYFAEDSVWIRNYDVMHLHKKKVK
jgi:hypothetical protein